MKMNEINPYVRIQTYYSLLRNEDIEVTITRISKMTEIYVELIRNDFCLMFKWQKNILNKLANKRVEEKWDTFLELDTNSEKYKEVSKKYNLDEEFENLLQNGKLDDIPIFIDYENRLYDIYLSKDEAIALQNFWLDKEELHLNVKKFRQTYSNTYFIKDSYLYPNENYSLNKKLDKINRAIDEGKCISIKYKTRRNNPKNIKNITLKPVKISYDANENLYSVLSVYNDRVWVYRLDRIYDIKESDEIITGQNEDLLKIYPNVWGNCFMDEPKQVKVKFYNEADVWNKVRKQLANRTNGKIYEKDGYLYYEDTVYGIAKFRQWIYSYGSSAIVLEPQSLREEIIESLKERLEREK